MTPFKFKINQSTIRNYSHFHPKKHLLIAFFLVFLLIGAHPSRATEAPPTPPLEFDHIEGQKIVFKPSAGGPSQRPYQTQLFNLKYLGVLRSPEKTGNSYFLFEAKTCQDCELEKSLFLINPKNEKPTAYTFPGKTFEPRQRQLVMDSRAFYGKCMNNKGELLAFFQLERVDRKRQLQPSVLVAEPKIDHLEEVLIERAIPKLKATLKRVKNGDCKEIEGISRLSSHKLINLHPSSKEK